MILYILLHLLTGQPGWEHYQNLQEVCKRASGLQSAKVLRVEMKMICSEISPFRTSPGSMQLGSSDAVYRIQNVSPSCAMALESVREISCKLTKSEPVWVEEAGID